MTPYPTIERSSFPFHKMEGAANDFVVVYAADLPAGAGPSDAVALCDRRRGIGADGVLVVGAGSEPGADASMVVWNADGTVSEMCGNGLRCVVRRLAEDGRWPADGSGRVETGAGLLGAWLRGSEVELEMGAPQLVGGGEPLRVEHGGYGAQGIRVSMGNPHFVVFADSAAELPDLTVWGPALELAPVFPNRSNVELVSVVAADRLDMRVWERGVGETMACGSGACAAVVAARLSGRVSGDAVDVQLPGGLLRVRWNGDPKQSVHLQGPARTVFAGRGYQSPSSERLRAGKDETT